jgi:hypothetical protein
MYGNALVKKPLKNRCWISFRGASRSCGGGGTLSASSRMSVYPSACNNSAPTRRIFIKFDISIFRNFVKKIQVGLKYDKITGKISLLDQFKCQECVRYAVTGILSSLSQTTSSLPFYTLRSRDVMSEMLSVYVGHLRSSAHCMFSL